jgi:hypothetical protein
VNSNEVPVGHAMKPKPAEKFEIIEDCKPQATKIQIGSVEEFYINTTSEF